MNFKKYIENALCKGNKEIYVIKKLSYIEHILDMGFSTMANLPMNLFVKN